MLFGLFVSFVLFVPFVFFVFFVLFVPFVLFVSFVFQKSSCALTFAKRASSTEFGLPHVAP